MSYPWKFQPSQETIPISTDFQQNMPKVIIKKIILLTSMTSEQHSKGLDKKREFSPASLFGRLDCCMYTENQHVFRIKSLASWLLLVV